MDATPVSFQVGCWVLTVLVLVSAVWVVALRNLFRAALSLGLVLVGVAGLFVLMEAEFLAFVQILVYVGAILTLVVFAIMLTANQQASSLATPPRQRIPAALAAGALLVLLARIIWAWPWPLAQASEAASLPQLGRELITTFVLPFEVIGLVFVAAIVGAIAVASSPPSRRPATDAHPKTL